MRTMALQIRWLAKRAGGPILGGMMLSLASVGCVPIPKADFDAYLTNFTVAKTAAEDIILSAKVAAQAAAQDPAADASIEARLETLDKRQKAFDARLTALEVIAQYNQVLVKLAAGEDPATVKPGIENLAKDLGSFGITQLSNLISGSGVPYVGMVTQAVAQIDDLIKKHKFVDAVEAAQKPVVAILGILRKDADDIGTILTNRLEMKRDPWFDQITELGIRFEALAKRFKKTKAIDELFAKHAEVRKQLKRRESVRVLVHAPDPDAKEADIEGPELMKVLIDQVKVGTAAYNETAGQIEAQKKVIEEYKNVLAATEVAFIGLNNRLHSNQRTATVAFLGQALKLRQAYLELKEAR